MNPRRLIFPLFITLAVVIIFGYFHGITRTLRAIVYEQGVQLKIQEKQLPVMAEYIQLVHAIQDASEDRLTAHEVVEMAKIIMEQCTLHSDIGLTPSRILAPIERESSFDPEAVSHAQAYGLMQCLESTFARHLPELGHTGLITEELMLDPIWNIRVGIAELIRLKKMWLKEGAESIDDWKITYYSYWAGEGWARHLLYTFKKCVSSRPLTRPRIIWTILC